MAARDGLRVQTRKLTAAN